MHLPISLFGDRALHKIENSMKHIVVNTLCRFPFSTWNFRFPFFGRWGGALQKIANRERRWKCNEKLRKRIVHVHFFLMLSSFPTSIWISGIFLFWGCQGPTKKQGNAQKGQGNTKQGTDNSESLDKHLSIYLIH